jgi:hypothetical protein
MQALRNLQINLALTELPLILDNRIRTFLQDPGENTHETNLARKRQWNDEAKP